MGAAAEGAALRKISKYVDLSITRLFVQLAFETQAPICNSGLSFLDELGGRLIAVMADRRARAFLLQRISVAIQRGNYVCFSSSFSRQ